MLHSLDQYLVARAANDVVAGLPGRQRDRQYRGPSSRPPPGAGVRHRLARESSDHEMRGRSQSTTPETKRCTLTVANLFGLPQQHELAPGRGTRESRGVRVGVKGSMPFG